MHRVSCTPKEPVSKAQLQAVGRRYFTLVELSAMGWYCRSRAQQRNEENSSFAFECVCVQEQRAPAVWTRQRHWVSRILILSTGGSLATPSLIAAANENAAALALLIDACAALRYVCGSGKPEWRMALLLAPTCTADMLARLIRGPVDKLSSCHCVVLERNVDFTHRCRRRQSLARASVAPGADAWTATGMSTQRASRARH
jgi:hypothetical protein